MKRIEVTLLTVAVVAVMVGGVALVAATGTVAADQHEPENAPTYSTSDGGVNFTINLPEQTDHYPGNQNEENGSIEYFAAGQAAFTEQDAEDGLWLNIIIVEADWIDYSACTTSGNTKEFGIDRGNNNSGTASDESLLEHQSGSDLEAGGLTVYFFNWDAAAGDPPYLSPEDAVVAAQGVGSNEGPCLTMTSEPGWYRIQAYTNGTIATKCTEEGNPDCEPEDKQWRGVNLESNYVYVCECDSEEEAREDLGAPPPERSGTPTPGGEEPTPTGNQSGDEPTPTGTQSGDEPTPTQTQSGDDPTPTETQAPTATATQGGGDDGGTRTATQAPGGGGDGGAADRGTPTIGDGPGFTPIAALVALLAAALVVLRRR
jgi:PGF-CTERM protein